MSADNLPDRERAQELEPSVWRRNHPDVTNIVRAYAEGRLRTQEEWHREAFKDRQPAPELHESIERDWQRQQKRKEAAEPPPDFAAMRQDFTRNGPADDGEYDAFHALINAVQRLYTYQEVDAPSLKYRLDRLRYRLDRMSDTIDELEKLTHSQLIGGDGSTHWYRMGALEDRVRELEELVQRMQRLMNDRGLRVTSLEERVEELEAGLEGERIASSSAFRKVATQVCELEQRTAGQQRVGGGTASDVSDPRG